MSARILIVDDIAANRQLLRYKLEAHYYDIVEASSGPEALDILKTDKPDIILLDVMMPEMDGYTVCRRIKEDPETSYIPVVMVTALSERDERVKGLEAGAEDFLTKPVNELALLTRIKALIRFNTVTGELRDRQARGEHFGATDIPLAQLDRPATIVLVDANELSSARITRLLEKKSHKVINAFAPFFSDTAFETADAVILSSVKQPYDPLRLCAKFRMTPAFRSISVLMIAHERDSDLAFKALDLGATDVIFSPIDGQELLARITTQIRRKRYVDTLRQRVDRGLELAVIDPLTGLYNRRFMERQLDTVMASVRRDGTHFSIIMIDIDYFKSINDTHGHEAGDVVLSQFGDWLKSQVRGVDTVYRLGGEEFSILMPATTADQAFSVADRLRRAFEKTPMKLGVDEETISVTFSAGIASSNSKTIEADTVLKDADAALYSAKMKGRNRVIQKAA